MNSEESCAERGEEDRSGMEGNDPPNASSPATSPPQTPRMDSPGEEENSESFGSPRSLSSESDDLGFDLSQLGFRTPPQSAPMSYIPNGPRSIEYDLHYDEDNNLIRPYEEYQREEIMGMGPCEPPSAPPPPPPYLPTFPELSNLTHAINYLLSSGVLCPTSPGVDFDLYGFNPQPISPLPSYDQLVPNLNHAMAIGYEGESPYYAGPGGMFGLMGGPNWIPPTPHLDFNNNNVHGCGGGYFPPPLPPPPPPPGPYHHPVYMAPPMMPFMMPVPPPFQETFPGFAQGQLDHHPNYPFLPPPPAMMIPPQPRSFFQNGPFDPYGPRPMGCSLAPPQGRSMPPMTPPAQIRSSRPLNPYSASFFPKKYGTLDSTSSGGKGTSDQSLIGPVLLRYRLDPPIQAPETERKNPNVDEKDIAASAPYVSNVWDSLMIAAMKPPPPNFVYYVPPRVDDNDYFGGQIHIWQDKMVTTFATFIPDVWTLQGLPEFDKYREAGWSYFTITCKLRFCCRKCARPWTSMRGKVHFAFKMDQLDTNNNEVGRKGAIFMKIFGQVCNKNNCEDNGFQTPACYPEEIHRVLTKLSEYIGFIQYGLPLSSKFYNEPDKAIRIGNPTSPHRPALCQACQQGICSRASSA